LASSSPRSAPRIPSTAPRGARGGSHCVVRATSRVGTGASEMERAPGEVVDDPVILGESRSRLRTASSRIARASRASSGASRGSRRASPCPDRAAHVSFRASLRARGAAVGADKDALTKE
jgi:hypothetical protein